MGLVQGFNHVAVVTGDIDRLAGFYNAVFDATLVQVEDVGFGRFGVVRLGDGVAVNLFEIAGNDHTTGRPTMFDRGHIDHFGIDVTDEASFFELRDRLVAGGHSSGEITDFGPLLGLMFTDPDGTDCEISLVLDPTLAGGRPPSRYAEPTAATTR